MKCNHAEVADVLRTAVGIGCAMAPCVRYDNEACNDVDNRAQEKEKTRRAQRPTAKRTKTLSICTKLRAVPI
jgi:hypothetical protein